MIRLDSPADYPKLDGVHHLIRQHIINYINGFLTEYDASDLSSIGSVFLLETEADITDHQSMGLSQPLENTLHEFAEILVFKGLTDTVRLLHVVIIISNSWGLDVYIPENLPSETLREHLYKEFVGEKIIEMES